MAPSALVLRVTDGMMLFKEFRAPHRYSLVKDPSGGKEVTRELDERPTKESLWRFWRYFTIVFGLALVLLIAGLTGFLLGSRRTQISTTDADISLDTVHQTFVYNSTFAEAPSSASEQAWESLFPPHGGFFHDPAIAPEGASLAVYHQLHCLAGMRHAYYAIYDALIGGKNISLNELPDYSTPWHTRHCIDFLRQMLMCNADTTIERNDPKLGGIRGFGVIHECKRWDQLIEWTLERQRAGER